MVTHGSAIADTKSEAVAALKTIIEGKFTVLNAVTGDLTNDGLEDWAGIVVRGNPPNVTQRLYVLTRDKNGLALAESSPEVGFTDCAGTCLPELLFKKGSFFVYLSSRGGWGASGATTQFKFYRGQWRAIGRQTYRLNTENDSEDSTDENLLTGAYISNGKKGTGKPAVELLKDFNLGEY
jgi:hypothetical protein